MLRCDRRRQDRSPWLGITAARRHPTRFLILFLPLVAAGLPRLAAGEALPPAEPAVTPLAISVSADSTGAFNDLLIYSFTSTLSQGERRIDLDISFLRPGSEEVFLDGMPLTPGKDYRLDAELGQLELFDEWAGSQLVLRAQRQALILPRLLALSPLRAWRDLAGSPALPAGRVAPLGGPEAAQEPAPSELSMGGSKSLILRLGSDESVALEQSLRLSLRGKLGDSTYVEAVLRDDDLPFQPQGNTERLEELDKVYLRVEGPAGLAQVGDFVFEARRREITPFQRDFQGIQGDWQGPSAAVSAWLASSRGIFRTEEFFGEDGLQGPYELLSALRGDGAVILAGSEHVHLNGKRLTRGRERDYIIDYDLGTLTFSTRGLSERR